MLSSNPLRFCPRSSTLLAAAALICASSVGRAADLHVPGAYPTIQSAIDAASAGDRVLVAPGSFGEMIDFLGKDLTVESTGGPEVTTVDAAGLGTVVTFASGEGAGSVLDGFTVTGGSATDGGGIFVSDASPTLRNLIVTGNVASDDGGGMYVSAGAGLTMSVTHCDFVENSSTSFNGGAISLDGNGSPPPTLDVRWCTFSGNSAFSSGGAIHAQNFRVRSVSSTFVGNTSGSLGGALLLGEEATLMSCRIVGNTTGGLGGGIMIFHNNDTAELVNCEVTGNTAENGGGIAALFSSGMDIVNSTLSANSGGGIFGGMRTIRNSVAWGNTVAGGGPADYVSPAGGTAISYSSIGGTGGSKNWDPIYGIDEGGNLDKDPCFIDPDGPDDVPGTLDDDFRPGRFARPVDAGDNAAVPVDVFDLDGDLDVNEPLPWDAHGAPRFADDVPNADRGAGSGPIVDMGALERQEDSVSAEWSVAAGESIQSAIDAACPQDVIHVAPGVYTEAIDFRGRDVVVRSTEGPGVTTIDATGLGTTAVTFASDEDEFATLDGFTVTGGSATDGGGILCRLSSPSLRNLIVTGNVASSDGGGILCDNAGATMKDLVVSDNVAFRGGGLYVTSNAAIKAYVVDCTFVGNTTTSNGGAICLNGFFPLDAALDVRGSLFSGNSGALGGAVYSKNSRLSVVSSAFEDNHSQQSLGGGALYLGSVTETTLMSCRIVGNTADNFGGGLYCFSVTDLMIAGCEITGNTAGVGGGGIGGLFAGFEQIDIVNSTVSANDSASGAGGLRGEMRTIRNSVVWGNTTGGGGPADYELPGGGTAISHSNIGGTGGSGNWVSTFGIDEGGNIDVDPLFASPASGDFSLGAGSPCIDAADNTMVPMDEFDLDGNGLFDEPLPYDVAGYARFIDDPSTVDTGVGPAPVVDMGGFESRMIPGTPFCFGDPGSGTPCPCSNDNDGTVPGSGCANGAFASGAQLTGSGMARVGADTLVLTTTGLHPNNTGLYFQANNAVNGGDGIVFGDGLRCAGGGVVRLQVRSSDASGASSTTIPLGAKGSVAPGDVKRYQCWYRDTSGNQPCGVGANDFSLSNGFEIKWLP